MSLQYSRKGSLAIPFAAELGAYGAIRAAQSAERLAGAGQSTSWARNLSGTETTYAFGYDNADQLTSAVLSNSGGTLTSFAFEYDLGGNRTKLTKDTVDSTYAHDDTNALTSESGPTPKTFDYDLNGNLIDDGTRQYTWDAANRLVKIDQGSNSTEFTYDGLSRRVRIVEKSSGVTTSDLRYVWSGSQPVAELNAAGTTVTRRFFGAGEFVTTGSVKRFYTRDHLGSVREVTDATGSLLARWDYDAWGNATLLSGSASLNAFGYAGYFRHELTGLSLTWFRAYDSTIGRWLSRDPIGEAGGLNLFGYVENGPADRVDELGLDWITGTADFVAGWGDTLTTIPFTDFSLTVAARGSLLSLMGVRRDSGVNKCSWQYTVGEGTGVLHSVALGGGFGARAAGTKIKGVTEFSHYIPDRVFRRIGNRRLSRAFGRSKFNGNYVTPRRHYMHDIYRFPVGYEQWGSKTRSKLLRELDQLPRLNIGLTGGTFWGLHGALGENGCE